MPNNTYTLTTPTSFLADFKAVTKMGLSISVVFSSLAGYLLAAEIVNFTTLLLFFYSNSFSQTQGRKVENLQNFDKQKIHFGYLIGFNQYNFKIDYKKNPNYTTQVEEELGLNIGLIGDIRLGEYLNLRFEPGLQTNKSALKFNERSKAIH